MEQQKGSAGARIILHSRHLNFVDLAMDRIHIKSTGGTPQNRYVDVSHQALCSSRLEIVTGELIRERALASERVCQSCVHIAQRFPAGWIEVEA